MIRAFASIAMSLALKLALERTEPTELQIWSKGAAMLMFMSAGIKYFTKVGALSQVSLKELTKSNVNPVNHAKAGTMQRFL